MQSESLKTSLLNYIYNPQPHVSHTHRHAAQLAHYRITWNFANIIFFVPVSRIRDVYPGSLIRIFPSASKKSSIFNPKTVSKLPEKSGMFIPDPDPDFFPSRNPDLDPGSRSPKITGSRIRIRNTDWYYTCSYSTLVKL
jgi:hypothetical protein